MDRQPKGLGLAKRATDLAHSLMETWLDEDSLACDLTLGNGHDCLALARLGGRVYGFDIQESALEATRARLREAGLDKKTRLFLAGHEDILDYIDEELDLAIMNLGYLPGGDKSLTTQGDTTVKALKGALTLLRPGGLAIVVLYRGHEGAQEEGEALYAFLSSLDQADFLVQRLTYFNQVNLPPEVFLVEKRFK